MKMHFLGLASQTLWASSDCMTLNSHVSLPKMLVNVGKVLEQIILSHMLIVIQPLLVCADA